MSVNYALEPAQDQPIDLGGFASTSVEDLGGSTFELDKELPGLGGDDDPGQGQPEDKQEGETGDDPEPKSDPEPESKSEEDKQEPEFLAKVLEIEGDSVKIQDLIEIYKDVKAEAPLYELGVEYSLIVEKVKESPEGAALALDMFEKAAAKYHGENWRALANAQPSSEVDVETLTENEKAIYSQLLKTQKALADQAKVNDELRETYQKSLEELKPTIDKAHANTILESAAAEIKKSYGEDVSTEELRRMLKETGVENPLQAWKIASYDRGASKPVQERKPGMPSGQTGEKTFVITKDMTADQIAYYLSRGYTPVDQKG